MTVSETHPALIDAEELARQRRRRVEKIGRWALPASLPCGGMSRS